MSDENKFFRLVWRLNAILLLALLLLVVIALSVRLAWHHSHSPLDKANFTDTVKMLKGWSTATLEPVDTPFAGLNGASERVWSLVDGGGPNQRIVRNILALNDKAGTSHWLFAPGPRVIVDSVMQIGRPDRENTVSIGYIGMVLVVADADTNKDGVVDERDRLSLYYYGLDDKLPVKMLAADRIILESTFVQDETLRLFVQDGGKSFELTYSLPDLVVHAKIPVSGLPNLTKPNRGVLKIGFTGIDRYLQ